MSGDELLDSVRVAIDCLIATADEYGGLVPSILDRHTGELTTPAPPAIPGQREQDRAPQGCNLLDDVPLLATIDALGDEGRPGVADAADRYLERFATRCTDTPTGLFPWGDHAYWNLVEQTVGDCYVHEGTHEERKPIHDQRAVAPPWLWERVHDFDPDCVQRFADGLDYHWTDPEKSHFSRHAWIEKRERGSWGSSGRSCDFPRHSGFYILDWATAYALDPRASTREQIVTMAEYWWRRRDDRGVLPYESEGFAEPSPEQTLSLAVCLFEAADVLPDESLASTLRRRATTYSSGFLATAPRGAPVWGSGYPNAVRAAIGLGCLAVYRHTTDEQLLRRAEAVGHAYSRVPFPKGLSVPAEDAGLALELFADLYAITGEDHWLTEGLDLAHGAISRYCDAVLPRAATGVDHYESALGPAHLLHSLARLGLVAKRDDDPLGPNYTRLPTGYQQTEAFPFG